MEMKKITQ